MLRMYVAALIELKAYARTKTKYVSVADRCNRILTEKERRFNRIGLINNYTKVLSVSIYFQVAYYAYQGNKK